MKWQPTQDRFCYHKLKHLHHHQHVVSATTPPSLPLSTMRLSPFFLLFNVHACTYFYRLLRLKIDEMATKTSCCIFVLLFCSDFQTGKFSILFCQQIAAVKQRFAENTVSVSVDGNSVLCEPQAGNINQSEQFAVPKNTKILMTIHT